MKTRNKSETIKAPTLDQNVIGATLHLVQVEAGLADIRKAKDADAAVLGDYFARLSDAFRNDTKIAPKNARSSFGLAKFDEHMDKVEAALKAAAGTAGIANFKLPSAWKQYKSNVKKFIGCGYAAQLHTEDGKPIGIGKITEMITARGREERASGDAFDCALINLSRLVEFIRKAEKPSDSDTKEGKAAKDGHRARIAGIVAKFAEALTAEAKTAGREAPDLLEVGQEIETDYEVARLAEEHAKAKATPKAKPKAKRMPKVPTDTGDVQRAA